MLRYRFVQRVEADLKRDQEVQATVSVYDPMLDQKHPEQPVFIIAMGSRPAEVANLLHDLLDTLPAQARVGLQRDRAAQHGGFIGELQSALVSLPETTVQPLLKRQAEAREQICDRAGRGTGLQPPEQGAGLAHEVMPLGKLAGIKLRCLYDQAEQALGVAIH